MHTLTTQMALISLFLFQAQQKNRMSDTDKRILERGAQVLKTMRVGKFSNACLLRYARKYAFETPALEKVIERLRFRRQCLLRAAWVSPFNIQRWCKFQKAAMQMADQMEDLFVEFYRHSGNPELIDIILCARFVQGTVIKRMLLARREQELLETILRIQLCLVRYTTRRV